MIGYYVYLIASLPMLHFGARPPLESGRFREMCRGLISEEDMADVEAACGGDICGYHGGQPTLRKFRNFETALRNELVRIRASRRRVDPAKYLRPQDEDGIATNHVAINAYRAASPLESERMLDQARWRALDELTIGRYFDIDALVAYAVKLSILEKWERIEKGNSPATLEATIHQ
jgi:hypothetical protein